MKLSHIASQIFVSRKKSYVKTYLARFESIDRMLEAGLLAMDLETQFVVLDASLHIRYMGNDKEYATFFDTLRAYVNYRRGLLEMSAVEYSERINFTVMLKEIIRFDENTGEFYNPPKEIPHPIIVGYYEAGKIDYTAYK